MGCTALKSIEIPDGVTEIGEAAFAHCIALERAVIPDSVPEIPETAFFGCRALKDCTVPLDKDLLAGSELFPFDSLPIFSPDDDDFGGDFSDLP